MNVSSGAQDASLIMSSAIDVVDKYVTPVWYVVGVPGNLLAFVVWTQKKMRASSGCYLADVNSVIISHIIGKPLHTVLYVLVCLTHTGKPLHMAS